MKHENGEWQVSNFELSKKLKELGVKQESFWYWNFYSHGIQIKSFQEVPCTETRFEENERKQWKLEEGISAFTVAELGEMLPNYIYPEMRDEKYGLRIWRNDKRWEIVYMYFDNLEPVHYVMVGAETEANARAKMLIYLIENKLMEVNE